jgi:hypothetical protein
MSVRAEADRRHPVLSRLKALALMRAYFDESGVHKGSLVTVIAGYVAAKDVWASLERKWNEELAVYADKGVKTFHMTECIAQSGEFSGLDTFFSRALIMKLSEVLRDHNVKAIWSSVVIQDWDEVVTDAGFLARFPKPFDLCFEHVVQQLWEWAKRNAGAK